jgi:hypothetical protein
VRSTIPLEIHDARGAPRSARDWWRGLRDEAADRAALTTRLAAAPFEAFFFEVAPITAATADQPAEAVLVDAPSLARLPPDPSPFAERFAAAPDDDVVVFQNLGGDATLVAPTPRADRRAYPHLACFVRAAPAGQVDGVWRTLAIHVERALSAAPLWVSTAGLGVAWLHFRLDSRPKYYRHGPFTRFPR